MTSPLPTVTSLFFCHMCGWLPSDKYTGHVCDTELAENDWRQQDAITITLGEED